MVIIIMAFFGNFMVKLYLNNIFNGTIDFFCFILVKLNPDFIILNIKFLIFDDFLIFEVLEPRIYSFYYTKTF